MQYSSIRCVLIFLLCFFFSAESAFPHHQFLQALVTDFNNQKELASAKNKFKPLKDSIYSFVDEDAKNIKKGRCIKIKYDFSGQNNNAEYGIWLNLRRIKLLPDQIFLTIFAKGDAADGFSKMVKIKLVAGKKESTYIVRGIQDNWQQFAIPLSDFRLGTEQCPVPTLTDLYIIFDNSIAGGGKGAVYIDEVAFVN